ncbi:MAG: hypothetical protein L3K19_00010 [Thermoplasmata archaeon]|nr:hypothetical protein [Thermoplasmata archaeon]
MATRGLPIGLVLIMLLSGAASALPAGSSPGHSSGVVLGSGPESAQITPAGPGTINTTLSVNASSFNLSNQFWGTTVNNEVRMFRGETNAVNATPARVLVWPGAMAGEDYDPFTNTHYDTSSGTGTHALTNESQFVQLCKATHCIAIMQVPAEIDNATFAAKIVNYTENNLSFVPAYWMIGNEPELWGHWQLPWSKWASQYSGGPTPTQFGDEVLAYVKAIRTIDNSTPILGLPASGCTCGSWTFAQWIYQVLKVTGPKIQAVAFHEYPAGWLGTGDGSLRDFYGTIQSPANIPIRMASARAAVVSGCPNCSVSVLISELGAALSWSAYGQYAIGFSGDLSIASQITQAMDDNLTNVDLFATELGTTNSWFGTTGHARPDYGLYTQILKHLGTQSYSVNLTGLDHTIYGIDTIAPGDQGRRDLMVVNDNITHSVAFSPQFAGFPTNAPVQAWSWNGSIHPTSGNNTVWVEPFTPNAVPHEFPDGLPGRYTLPPQSLVLFEMYPSGGSYVRVVEHGVPAPTPWYASIGPNFYTTTASNLSLLLPNGSYAAASVPISLPINGTELAPVERLEPFVPSPFQVSGRYTNVSVNYVPQWSVDLTESPVVGGTVDPQVHWGNDSAPLTVTATPAPNYAFLRWSGWGPGSYNGADPSATLFPTGRVFEKARFVPTDVDLWETGLPKGTPWSVTIRGVTTSSSTYIIPVYEPPGSYGFTVNPVPGYRSLPENGGFIVNGSRTYVEVQFVHLTPPSTSYMVEFRISGLVNATPVTISVRGVNVTTVSSDPQFELINGSYAYDVGYVAGFHPAIVNKTFAVLGGPLIVDVPFVQTQYQVTWVAFGTRSGLNWSVSLAGQPLAGNSSWVSVHLPNGTYSYAISSSANYSVNPDDGVLAIDGAPSTVTVYFNVLQFPAMFEVTGQGAPSGWSVRLGNVTHGAASDQSSFMAPNGTYTFDVRAPPGYYAVPSHGNVTVAGPTPPIMIQFHLSSERPSAALVAALTSGALSEAVWLGVSIFVGFVVYRGLRHRGG